VANDFPVEEIIAYCKSKFPEEACGFVTVVKGRHKWIPCENVAGNKNSFFAIHPLEFAKASDSGEIIAVVHSHTIHPTVFSETDVAFQKIQGIPWMLVGLQSGEAEIEWLRGEKQADALYGRKYIWHVTDCYSFIKDWYLQEKKIYIPDFAREEYFWKKNQEIYLDNFAKAGFSEVPLASLQEGDVLLMHIGGNITGHGAVYLGNNKIGHHLPGRLSSIDVIGQFYLDRVTKVVRHKDMFK